MNFKQKYTIIPRYLTVKSKRRSGNLVLPTVKFVVAHDTGNANSTASGNVKYYELSRDKDFASAHIFVDDKEIIECIPALTSDKPEKAWHVLYDRQEDNKLFGFNANDVAIGVEYCFGPNINADEAYSRYIWVIAYICYKFNLDPKKSITGHCILDPGRKTDPVNGLKQSGRTFEKLLQDIVTEYNNCTKDDLDLSKKFMKLIGTSTSPKVFMVGTDNKKHWIADEDTFKYGQEMGLWSANIEIKDNDGLIEGHIISIKNNL